jgi:hypothetical protein
MRRHYGKQREIMETQVTEFPELLEVVDVMTEYMFSHIYGEKHVIIQ